MLQKLLGVWLFLWVALQVNAQEPVFKAGDVLFQDLNCGPLCDAIESVTFGIDSLDFSHVGWVVEVDDSLQVLEAIGGKVRLTSISLFLRRSVADDGSPLVVGMRFKKNYSKHINQWQKKALRQLNRPYDDAFLPNNEAIYCAEVLTENCLIKGKPVFPLEPMTFKDPKTKEFFSAWVDYYRDLRQPIPEQIPGMNPGALSRSPVFYLFYRFGKKLR